MLHIVHNPSPPRAMEHTTLYQKFRGRCNEELKLVLLSEHNECDQGLLVKVEWITLGLDEFEVYFEVAKQGTYSTVVKKGEPQLLCSEESEPFTVEPRDWRTEGKARIVANILRYFTMLWILILFSDSNLEIVVRKYRLVNS
jgi:hypothetical protein